MAINLKKTIFAEIACFILQIIFSNIFFGNMVCPFGLPFALVRIYFGGNIFCIIFSYLISKINRIFIFSDLFVCFYEIVILSLYYFIKNFKFRKRPLLLLESSIICSAALEFYYILLLRYNLVLFFVNLISKLIITAFFYRFFKIYQNKCIFFKFSNIDYLYFSLIIIFIAFGVYGFPLDKIRINYLFLSTVIIFSCLLVPSDKFFALSLSLGIGAVVASGDSNLLIFSTICSILTTIIKDRNKYIYSIVSIFSIFIVYFVGKDINLISLALATIPAFIVMFLPNSLLKKLSSAFEVDSFNLMFENFRKEKVFDIKKKLNLMATTLKTMQRDFKFLVVGKISRDKACIELSQDIINSCCKNCENFRTCFFENINKRSMFENLLSKAIEKGKINKDDVVMGLQVYCLKEGIIISEINQMASAFAKFENAMKTEDTSKLMIADELGNFADIFANFSNLININIGYNKVQSNMLKDSLLNNMISAKEVMIIENDVGIETVNLIAQNEHVLRKEIIDVISKFARSKFKLAGVHHLNYTGLSYAAFIPCEKLKINFAIASKSKENKNGDNIAMSKLSRNKYFIALADGMGHGESANRISSMVLSLIKSMFEIGFDDELIIQSINKLIIPAGIDNFTSLDACVIDLEHEISTFIKLGASVSVLKHQNTSELISCASLPIGIVENIRPTIIRKHISLNDTIFLASDGIVDSFTNIEEYKNYINDSKILNVQRFVDDVLFDANFQNQKHPDDMTIIAINILKNY